MGRHRCRQTESGVCAGKALAVAVSNATDARGEGSPKGAGAGRRGLRRSTNMLRKAEVGTMGRCNTLSHHLLLDVTQR
jgi:hypothetical protein